jgi:hypothetical protein
VASLRSYADRPLVQIPHRLFALVEVFICAPFPKRIVKAGLGVWVVITVG